MDGRSDHSPRDDDGNHPRVSTSVPSLLYAPSATGGLPVLGGGGGAVPVDRTESDGQPWEYVPEYQTRLTRVISQTEYDVAGPGRRGTRGRGRDRPTKGKFPSRVPLGSLGVEGLPNPASTAQYDWEGHLETQPEPESVPDPVAGVGRPEQVVVVPVPTRDPPLPSLCTPPQAVVGRTPKGTHTPRRHCA